MVTRAEYLGDAQLQMVEINVGAAAVGKEFPPPVLRVVIGAVFGQRTIVTQRSRRAIAVLQGMLSCHARRAIARRLAFARQRQAVKFSQQSEEHTSELQSLRH